jgi:hypothetical protein
LKVERRHVRSVGLDLVAIVSVAFLLAVIHVFVPPDVESRLVFRYGRPDPLTALTAAYFHLDIAHLVGNVGGFLVGALLVYSLCLSVEERRWFWLTTLAFLTILPILVNFTSAGIIGEAPGPMVNTERGFSGVVAGYAGFLLITTSIVLRRLFGYDRRTARDVTVIVVIVLAGEVSSIYLDDPPLGFIALLGLGLVVASVDILDRSRPWRVPAKETAIAMTFSAILILLLVGVLSWYVFGLFPSRPSAGGSTTNVLAHYSGFVYGGIISLWGYRYWKAPR